MRYVLVGGTVVVLVFAGLLIQRSASRDASPPPMPAAAVATVVSAPAPAVATVVSVPTAVVATVVSLPDEVVATSEPIEPSPAVVVTVAGLPDGVVVSREDAIQGTIARARGAGEDSPELIDALLLPLGTVKMKLSHGDGRPNDMLVSRGGLPDDTLVWMVRMRGDGFVIPRPQTRDEPLTPGWIWVVINAESGMGMALGIAPTGEPIR